MKNPLLLSLVALVVGAAALVSTLLTSPSSNLRQETEALPAPDVEESLRLRIEELTAENRALSDRLSALELHPGSAPSSRAPAASAFVSQGEFDAFREEVRLALAGRSEIVEKIAADPEGFKDHVASTLSEIRKDEAVSKVRAKQETQLERLDETMPKIEQWLQLTPHQSNQMRSALLARYDREAELIRRWEAGEDPEALGELKRSDREAHHTDLSAFLTPAQLETYASRGGGGGK